MKVNEILVEAATKMVKANKANDRAQKLAAVEVGQKPDAALQAFLQKLAAKAEGIVFKRVISNPDNYGIDEQDHTTKEIRNGTHIWAQFAHVDEKGITIDLNVDTDDIGGDSTNHESVSFTLDGKEAGKDSEFGEFIGTFDAQADWTRDE